MWITGGWSPSGKSLQLQIPPEDLTWTHHTNIITKTAALLPLQTQEAQYGERRHLNFYQEYNSGPGKSCPEHQQSGSAIHGGALNCRIKSRWIKTDDPQTVPATAVWSSGSSPAWGPDHHTQEQGYSTEKSNCVTLAHLFTFAHPVIRSVLQGELSGDGCYDVSAL